MPFRIGRRGLLAGAAAAVAVPMLDLASAAPADAAPVSAKDGGLAEVVETVGTQIRVRVIATGEELVIPPRRFAKEWKHAAGDLVVVQPTSTSDPQWAQSVAEPLTRVVPVSGGLEVWAANLNEGPRLGARVPR
jgi:hypothetical protein